MKSSLEEPMPDLTRYPFWSYFEAIRFYNLKSPVRMKSVNLLETEHGEPPDDEVWLWTQVCYAIESALKPATEREQRQWHRIFRLREAWADVAQDAHIEVWLLKHKLRKINDRLEKELIDRKLMPPEKSLE